MSKNGNNIIMDMERGTRARELISASQIFRIELYLTSGIRSRHITTKKETQRIVDKYQLEKHPSEGNPKYTGDPQVIYNELRKEFTDIDWDNRFPNHDGKGYKRLVYALLYGESNCKVIKKENNEAI